MFNSLLQCLFFALDIHEYYFLIKYILCCKIIIKVNNKKQTNMKLLSFTSAYNPVLKAIEC